MHGVESLLIDPRYHRPIMTSILRARNALEPVTIPCAILRRSLKLLASPEQMAFHHVLVGEARPRHRVIPMLEGQRDRPFGAWLYHLDGDVPVDAHVQQHTCPRGCRLSDLAQMPSPRATQR